MAVVCLYLLICLVRLTMPGIDSRDRNTIGIIRIGIAILGTAAGYLFLYACFKAKGHLVRDPQNAQTIALLIFGVFAATAEYISRRKLRQLDIFPRNKRIPWTY